MFPESIPSWIPKDNSWGSEDVSHHNVNVWLNDTSLGYFGTSLLRCWAIKRAFRQFPAEKAGQSCQRYPNFVIARTCKMHLRGFTQFQMPALFITILIWVFHFLRVCWLLHYGYFRSEISKKCRIDFWYGEQSHPSQYKPSQYELSLKRLDSRVIRLCGWKIYTADKNAEHYKLACIYIFRYFKGLHLDPVPADGLCVITYVS